MTLPKTTEKQKDIIDNVFRFRFINRYQIQKIVGHKDSKRVNVWLKDLVEKNYLGRIYSRKLLENTKPAVYYLSLNGIRYLKREKGIKGVYTRKLYFEKNKSDIFINHNLFIAELYTKLSVAHSTIEYGFKFDNFTFATKSRLSIRKGYRDVKEIKDIIPDVHIRIVDIMAKTKKEKKENGSKDYFLDLFDFHVPGYALRHRVNQYINFYDWEFTKERQELMKMYTFPTILFVFSNPKKIKRIKTYIQDKLYSAGDFDNLTFLLTTTKELEEKGLDNPGIWRPIEKDEY